MKHLATPVLLATGTAVVTLTLLWPRPTHADDIADWERQGEYEEDGMRFGDIVVKGALVPDRAVPGGWALVRTLENRSDEPQNCVVEERVMRTEGSYDGRVGSTPTAVLLRNQPIKLAARQKLSIGVALPQAMGEEITRTARDEARARRAMESPTRPTGGYANFHVEYLQPLPPGARAARSSSAGMGMR
jgi:hypothetical protein